VARRARAEIPEAPAGDGVRAPSRPSPRPRAWAVVHLAAALFCCLILPAYSKVRGEGGLSWTMFSRSDSFRLDLRATDRAGAVHLLHPAELGSRAEPALRYFLLGADRFRTWPVGPTFRARLPYLALLACEIGPYASIDLTLEERADLDAAPHPTHVHVTCR
jgi:hypothetical protein